MVNGESFQIWLVKREMTNVKRETTNMKRETL